VTLVATELDGVICARYVCAIYDTCGFNINAFENCREYAAIMQAAQSYLFYLDFECLRCERSPCEEHTIIAVVERTVVPAGDVEEICLNHELQLLYVCQKCETRLSIPQLLRERGKTLRCVCNRVCTYHNGFYKCPVQDGGCGVYFHEYDSLTFMHTNIVQDEVEDNVWVYFRNVAPQICGTKGVLKYVLDEKSMKGQLIYRCKLWAVHKDLFKNHKNIFEITVLSGGMEI
jgi:hypothetical protein